jgi:REP element-mobilizing transposase RayT
MKLRPGLPDLRHKTLAKIVLQSLGAAKKRLGVRVVHFSVQSNHVHILVEADGKPALSRAMKGIAIRLALRLNDRLDRRGPLFADRYHARALTTPLAVRRALVYVLRNNVHHARGVGSPTRFDPLSSAPYFDGFATKVYLPKNSFVPPEVPPVVPPNTWLLQHGWRRLGLIRREEAPALHPQSPRGH